MILTVEKLSYLLDIYPNRAIRVYIPIKNIKNSVKKIYKYDSI